MRLVVPPRIVLLLSAAAAASVAGAALSSRVIETRQTDTAGVAATWRALASTERVLSLLSRAEAACRDHSASGSDEARRRYTEARSEVEAAIERQREALPRRLSFLEAWASTSRHLEAALGSLDCRERTPASGPAHAVRLAAREDRRRAALERAEAGLEHVGTLERNEVAKEERALARSTSLATWVIVSTYSALLLLVGIAAVAVRGHLKERERREAEQRRVFELQQQLIGIVGHDLRTPLNAIAGSAELLARAPDLPSGRLRMAQRIVSSAGRMSRMVRDLLDYTRALVAGGLPVSPEPAHLGEICRRVVQEVGAARPGDDIRLTEEGDLSGEWDPARLEQVFSNLVANACHYGSEGRPVLVRASGTTRDALVDVHNEGPPIPAEVLPHIFEPFQRGTPGRPDASGNVGLGLFIVRSLVEAHGGKIAVDTGSAGTTFRVALPRSVPACRDPGATGGRAR